MLTRVLLIRHAMTDAIGHHLAGIAPGTPLNETGRAQVSQLVERLHDVALTAIICSPLERTIQTAEPLARDHRLIPELNAAFLEYNVGDWTGATLAALESDAAWQRFNSIRSMTRPPRGELMIDVQHRAVTALLDICGRFGGGTIAIVSHGDVIRSILLYLLGMPIDFFHRLEISPARISVCEIGGDAPRVLLVNGDNVTGLL